jgi:hypothetical protein
MANALIENYIPINRDDVSSGKCRGAPRSTRRRNIACATNAAGKELNWKGGD